MSTRDEQEQEVPGCKTFFARGISQGGVSEFDTSQLCYRPETPLLAKPMYTDYLNTTEAPTDPSNSDNDDNQSNYTRWQRPIPKELATAHRTQIRTVLEQMYKFEETNELRHNSRPEFFFEDHQSVTPRRAFVILISATNPSVFDCKVLLFQQHDEISSQVYKLLIELESGACYWVSNFQVFSYELDALYVAKWFAKDDVHNLEQVMDQDITLGHNSIQGPVLNSYWESIRDGTFPCLYKTTNPDLSSPFWIILSLVPEETLPLYWQRTNRSPKVFWQFNLMQQDDSLATVLHRQHNAQKHSIAPTKLHHKTSTLASSSSSRMKINHSQEITQPLFNKQNTYGFMYGDNNQNTSALASSMTSIPNIPRDKLFLKNQATMNRFKTGFKSSQIENATSIHSRQGSPGTTHLSIAPAQVDKTTHQQQHRFRNPEVTNNSHIPTSAVCNTANKATQVMMMMTSTAASGNSEPLSATKSPTTKLLNYRKRKAVVTDPEKQQIQSAFLQIANRVVLGSETVNSTTQNTLADRRQYACHSKKRSCQFPSALHKHPPDN